MVRVGSPTSNPDMMLSPKITAPAANAPAPAPIANPGGPLGLGPAPDDDDDGMLK